MIKILQKIFFLFLFINSLNAEYLMTLTMTDKRKDYIFSRCIDYYFTDDSYLYYHKSLDDTTYAKDFEDIKNYTIVSGFYLDSNDACIKFTDSLSNMQLDNTLPLNSNSLTYLGLSDEDLNLSFAFSGVLISFLFLFGLFRWI